MLKTLMNTPEQIGERLKKVREERGLSLDDAAFQSRLPRNIIESLEEEDFSQFISPLYARSFLRQYSDFLEVNALPWLDGLQPAEYLNDNPQLSLLQKSQYLSNRTEPELRQSSGTGSNIFILLLSAGLIYGGIILYRSFDKTYGKEADVRKEDASVIKPAIIQEEAAPQEPPAAVKIPPTPEEDPISHVPPRAIVVE